MGLIGFYGASPRDIRHTYDESLLQLLMRSDITLVSINWNAKQVMELMLRSFAKYHEPCRLMLVDNGSTDGSKEWLYEQGIPFFDFPTNIGHEAAINVVYPAITTKYVLLVDTDVIFYDNVFTYLNEFTDTVVAAGDLVKGDQLNEAVKPRLGAWFIMFNIEACRKVGITKFRDTSNWSYDVGSHFYERLWMANLQPLIIPRKPGNIDTDIIGMDFSKFGHFGKLSWNLENHRDRESEVNMRRKYAESRLNEFRDVNLKGVFI